MTLVLCPKSACICCHEEGYCVRDKIELEFDLCESGLMDCIDFEED